MRSPFTSVNARLSGSRASSVINGSPVPWNASACATSRWSAYVARPRTPGNGAALNSASVSSNRLENVGLLMVPRTVPWSENSPVATTSDCNRFTTSVTGRLSTSIASSPSLILAP